jgi:hypothetical protein
MHEPAGRLLMADARPALSLQAKPRNFVGKRPTRVKPCLQGLRTTA